MLKTHVYATSLIWEGGSEGRVSSTDVPPIHFSAPREFGGTGHDWTPEQLLVASAESCILMTFLAYAVPKKLVPLRYESRASGTLGPDPEGHVRFVDLWVRPRVTVRTEEEAAVARGLFEKIAGKCFIGSSLKAEPQINPEIVVREREDALPFILM